MKKLKLNQIEKNILTEKEMNIISGGLITCGCGCNYAGSGGGSSTMDNGNANKAGGKFSYGENKIAWCADPEDTGWKDLNTWGVGV